MTGFILSATRGTDRVLSVLRTLSGCGVWICGGLLMALSLGTALELLLRRFANHSFTGMDELGGYALAIVAAFAFTETLFVRGHIRIDIVHQRLPAAGKAVLDLIAMAGLIAFFGMVLYYGWLLLARSFTMGTRSMSPLAVVLWVPQLLWVAGLGLFVVSSALLSLRAILALIAGDGAGAQALIGTLSADDELAGELELAKASGIAERETPEIDPPEIDPPETDATGGMKR